MGKIENQKQLVETGTARMVDGNNFHRSAVRNYNKLAIRQGIRRKHPDHVLAQFEGVMKQTSNASSAWEKAIMHEHERVEIPAEYKAKDGDLLVNQTGLVTTSVDNFKKSKKKMQRQILAGV